MSMNEPSGKDIPEKLEPTTQIKAAIEGFPPQVQQVFLKHLRFHPRIGVFVELPEVAKELATIVKDPQALQRYMMSFTTATLIVDEQPEKSAPPQKKEEKKKKKLSPRDAAKKLFGDEKKDEEKKDEPK